MLNLYFAGKFENRFLIKCLIQYLTSIMEPFKITSDWVNGGYVPSIKTRAKIDFTNIDNSNLLIAVQPLGHGGISEIAYALGKKIPVICIVEELIWFQKIDPEWGWATPLPTGRLNLYNSDNGSVNFNKESPGYIIYEFKDLIKLLNLYSILFE